MSKKNSYAEEVSMYLVLLFFTVGSTAGIFTFWRISQFKENPFSYKRGELRQGVDDVKRVIFITTHQELYPNRD